MLWVSKEVKDFYKETQDTKTFQREAIPAAENNDMKMSAKKSKGLGKVTYPIKFGSVALCTYMCGCEFVCVIHMCVITWCIYPIKCV